LESQLASLVSLSAACLSISPAMSTVYRARYGRPFYPLANYVDQEVVARVGNDDTFIVRYCGALAENMTRDTVWSVIDAVEALASEGHVIKLEIYTMAWCLKAAIPKRSRNVSVAELVSDQAYPQLLASSDLLLIGYNFDAESIAYVRYSMANKLADYLSAGVPTLVIGPEEIETVRFCKAKDIGFVCTSSAVDDIKVALLAAKAIDGNNRAALVARAVRRYAEFCNSNESPEIFAALLRHAAGSQTL